MGVFAELVKGAASVLPEVPKPTRKPSLTEKLVWTAIALILYLAMSQVPLYGVTVGAQDQLAYTRIIFASNAGTLMELGIGPIVTAGLILQLLKGSDILKLDFKKPEDRALFTSATKLLTMIVILGEGLAYIIGGAYGVNLPMSTISIILIQLFAAGVIVMLLDELVQKGWGLGSGISLFILAGVAQKIIWDLFSPLFAGEGPFGVIPYTITAAINGTVHDAVFRVGGLPSLFGLAMTVLIILFIVYVEGMRIEIPITSARYRGFAGVYPIKLIYTSVVPIILVSALVANITFFSQLIWSRFNPSNTNPFINWLATFDPADPGAGPTGGLIRYLSPPRGFLAALEDPIRAGTYIVFILIFAVIFSKIWVEIGGLSPKAAAKSLVDAQVQVPGFRRSHISIEHLLSKYIPVITILSGLIIGVLASVSDLVGAFGSGTGILLMIDIILNYYQILTREHLETMMPRLGALLGRR